MKNAMKRWLSLLLTVLMVATALPFAALAEGDTAAAGLIEEDLVPVEPEQAQTTPTVNVSNAVSAAELLAAGEVGKGVTTTSIGGADSITIKVGESKTVTSTLTGTSAEADHQESWTSSNESVATVKYDVGSDYKATSVTITGVAAGKTTVKHKYYTTSQMIFWTNWTENSEEIEVNVTQPEEYTVTFDIGAEAAAAGVTTPDSITVQEGSTISNLPMLMNWKDDSGEKYFAGWYSDAEYNTPFTSQSPVSAENTKLFAKWVGSNEAGNYYVEFKSQDGKAVLITLVAAEGQTVGEYSNVPEIANKRFLGWSETMQGETDTRETFAEKKFDFTKPISEAVKEGERSIILYAWYWDTVTVSFEPECGTAVDALVTFKGDAVQSEPGISTRIGYTFKHWSETPNGETAFDFNTKLNENIKLYAVWDAALVKVNIVYVLEKANYSTDDDKYELAGNSLTVYAPTGSTVKIVPSSDIKDLTATHKIQYQVNGSTEWQDAKTSASGETAATLPDIYDTYFQYTGNSKTDGIEVLPNSSTVIQAYYDRAMITLNFSYIGLTSSTLDTTKGMSAENAKNYSGDGQKFTYKFTARYGQDITDAWPRVSWVTGTGRNSDNGGSTTDTTEKDFGGWKKPNGGIQYTDVKYMVADLFGDSLGLDSNRKLVGTATLTSWFQNTYSYYALYARTTLDGEKADFVADGYKYTIYSDESRNGSSAWLMAKDLDGCTSYGTYGGEYENSGDLPLESSSTSLNGYYFVGSTPTKNGKTVSVSSDRSEGTVVGLFQTEFGDGFKLISKNDSTANASNASQGTRIMVLLYDRNRLNITLHGNDDVLKDVSTADAEKPYYGDRIYNDDSDYIKVQEKKLSKVGYRFAGWYTTADCSDGTQFEASGETRIYKNLELWAKWEPDEFHAEFYLYADDKSPYRTEYFAEAGTLTNWEVPLEVKSYFIGWYYYNSEDEYVLFNFSNAVGAANVDETGTMKLYAEWKEGYGKVQYLPGEGGLASQARFDEQSKGDDETSGYQIGKAMVHLAKPEDVWPKGKTEDGDVPKDEVLKFIGWEAPDGTIYQPGKWVLVTRQLMQFTAIWSKDAVTLTYHANGGTGSDVSENYPRNYEAKIWDNKDYNDNTGKWEEHFTRSGYELIGWDTDPNATTPTYELGEGDITLTADETHLYAIWKRCVADVVLGKVVDGNMGSWSKIFTFSVSYTVDNVKTELSPVTLSHDQTATLKNIPIGATITITESDYDSYTPSWVAGETATTGTASALKEAISGSDTSGSTATATVAESGTTIIFTNVNEVTVDTGILLDSLPYVLILTLVAVVLVVWFIRRRRDD